MPVGGVVKIHFDWRLARVLDGEGNIHDELYWDGRMTHTSIAERLRKMQLGRNTPEAMTLADKMVILNEGRIEQVGSPDEINNFPNNLFVAEFIGTPKMNIIKINKSNIINNNTLRIFGKEYEFKNYKFSNEIFLGIRPEHIHPNLKHEIEFNINIDLIENLGSDKIIYGLFKDNEIRIRTSEDLPQNNTSFSFNKDKIVFFDNKKNKI